MRIVFLLLVVAVVGFIAAGNWRAPQSKVDYESIVADCAAAPDTECLAKLAVLRLPALAEFRRFERDADNFRMLGFSDLVDARMPDDGRDPEPDRDVSYRMYHRLVHDVDEFLELPLHDNPFAYSPLVHWLRHDHPRFGGGSGFIADAERAALARRGERIDESARAALLSRWRESLETHGGSAFNWLLHVNALRLAGDSAAARHALDRALVLPISDVTHSRAMTEVWNLHGIDRGYEYVLDIDDPEYRWRLILNLGHRVLEQDGSAARRALDRFADEFEMPELPGNTWYLQLTASAARLAHALGDRSSARHWADLTYRKARAYWFLPAGMLADSARLFADIGETEQAVAVAYETLDFTPAPGAVFSGGLHWYRTSDIHLSIAAEVLRILCSAGRYEEAFTLIGDDEDLGYSAAVGCLGALYRPYKPLSIAELSRSLNLESPRLLEMAHAARLVADGDAGAAGFIRRSLVSPPLRGERPQGGRNLPYLRLAVAMRDKALVRDVAASLVAESAYLDDRRAASVLASAAVLTRKWPGIRD